MNSHVSLLSNEGWNAYYAQRAMGLDSGPLYPPAGSMTFNNYPPASFYVVGALGWLVGDMVLAGRIIALLSLLSCSFMAGCIVRRLGGTPPAAGFTAWLLVFYAAVFDSDYIAVNDPQWLAQAIILSALLLLVPHRQAAFPGAGRILCAGLVTAVGLGFKHNILALPVAITLWLVVTDRRAALAWGTGLVMGGVVLGGMFAACFGPDFIHGVLGHRRTVYPGGLVKGAGNVLALGGLIVSAVLLPRLRLARGQGLLMGLYLFWAVVCAIGQRMGRGVSHNASFEALVAAVICAGLGVSYLATRSQAGSRFAPRSCVAFLVGINLSVVVGALPFYVPLLYRTTIGVRASIPAWNETIADIRQVDGNVACEILAACYWAGKPEMIDFFNYSQYVAVTHDASALQRAMDGHGIAAFVSGSRFRAFGPVWKFGTLWAVIRTRYTHVRPAGMAYIVTP